MTQSKTHYRKVMKSDHLGIADLEDLIEEKKPLVFTIKEVKQFTAIQGVPKSGAYVAGKYISANIAFFNENIKPLVLNSTNCKVVKSFANNSPFVEDWKNILVELYIDESVKMKGEIVGGVRIKQVKPTPKNKPLFTEANFEKAKSANATIEQIEKSYLLTEQIKLKYISYAAGN